ncbi:MAG: hypothetical protein M2R45_05391 [Verrucomicrobia subdivision 3 bacterium]|nr:hypothetical protein [Limisphaerales bacterium]MCS1417855.1 hypothetical protein [Limisphaerales bacterium]
MCVIVHNLRQIAKMLDLRLERILKRSRIRFIPVSHIEHPKVAGSAVPHLLPLCGRQMFSGVLIRV